MRALALVAAVLLAGCAAEQPAAATPPTHHTDCNAAPESETCTTPTRDSPIAMRSFPYVDRTVLEIEVRNDGVEPLAFSADPPPVSLYGSTEKGFVKVAFLEGGSGPGRTLGPGENLTIALHYGRAKPTDRARNVSHEPAGAPEDWPPGTYRACVDAEPGERAGWVRGCRDFRIRAKP